MPIEYRGGRAVLTDVCTVEEAEGLLEWLTKTPKAEVDLAAAGHLHTAVLQVLLAVQPRIAAPPADGFLSRWVAPALEPNPEGEAST